jgi:hypothetical protein
MGQQFLGRDPAPLGVLQREVHLLGGEGAQDATQDENDVNQLAPMLEACEEQAGRLPEEALADAGYWSEENAGLENETPELFIATIKDWKQRKELKEKGAPRGPIPKDATARDRMERKLLTQRGKKIYQQRGSTIEPVFGQMAMRGLNRIWLRGIKKAKGEWSLWCTTHNLLKLWRPGYQPLCAGAMAPGSGLATVGKTRAPDRRTDETWTTGKGRAVELIKYLRRLDRPARITQHPRGLICRTGPLI